MIYDQLVKISCLAHGYPIPSIQWEKDGLNVTNVTINKIIIKGNNTIISTLIIHHANYVHSGKYYCSASNDLALLVNEQLMITDVLVICELTLQLKTSGVHLLDTPLLIFSMNSMKVAALQQLMQ